MKKTALVGSILVLLAALSLYFVSARVFAELPPLSLDGYLDEELPEAKEEKEEEKADNAACYVCHANFKGEPLVHRHAMKNVGCVDCHGESVPHLDDEDHVTPPDIMIAKDGIDKSCGKCHAKHDVPGKKVIQRWQEKCPEVTNMDDLTCTACHFEHRIEKRTVIWDKKTRELLSRAANQD